MSILSRTCEDDTEIAYGLSKNLYVEAPASVVKTITDCIPSLDAALYIGAKTETSSVRKFSTNPDVIT